MHCCVHPATVTATWALIAGWLVSLTWHACSWSTVTPGLPVMQKRYAGWLDVSDIAAAVLSMSISDRKEAGLVSAVSAAFSEDVAHTAIACINKAAGNPFWAGEAHGVCLGWLCANPWLLRLPLLVGLSSSSLCVLCVCFLHPFGAGLSAGDNTGKGSPCSPKNGPGKCLLRRAGGVQGAMWPFTSIHNP